jgi:hypothetical protein
MDDQPLALLEVRVVIRRELRRVELILVSPEARLKTGSGGSAWTRGQLNRGIRQEQHRELFAGLQADPSVMALPDTDVAVSLRSDRLIFRYGRDLPAATVGETLGRLHRLFFPRSAIRVTWPRPGAVWTAEERTRAILRFIPFVPARLLPPPPPPRHPARGTESLRRQPAARRVHPNRAVSRRRW